MASTCRLHPWRLSSCQLHRSTPYAPVRRKLRRLEPLIPGALFVAPFGAGGVLVAAADANSPLSIALAIALVIASFSGLVAWVLITDRRATKPLGPCRGQRMGWQEFERSFGRT